jgi:hypothetical protein
VQAQTVSAIAGAVAAGIGAISATVAAISAFNSRKSAQASEAALREARRQREIDNARTELQLLGELYDDALALVRALALDRVRNPAAVEHARESVKRSMMIAGLTTSGLTRLVEADAPLSTQEIADVREELTEQSAGLWLRIAGHPAPGKLQKVGSKEGSDGV